LEKKGGKKNDSSRRDWRQVTANMAEIGVSSGSHARKDEGMSGGPARKRLKISCGELKLCFSVPAGTSVKDACAACEQVLARKDKLGKRRVRTFKVMPEELELDVEENIDDVVMEHELLEPIFFGGCCQTLQEGVVSAPQGGAHEARPAVQPLLQVKYTLASTEGAKAVRISHMCVAELRVAIATEEGATEVGLFSSAGIELAKDADDTTDLKAILAQTHKSGINGEGTSDAPLFVVFLGKVGDKMAKEKFGQYDCLTLNVA
jgi:hypothetical protein